MAWYGDFGGWPEYVPVGKRIEAAKKHAAKRAKRAGRSAEPVQIKGRAIATTFWGKSWCRNLEQYSDFSNRLPRGRTYARNGSVADLLVTRGRIEAVVAGSEVYDVAIAIAPLAPEKWRAIKRDCATSIGSLIDLLTGRIADDVMRRLVQPDDGMFPSPRQIKVKCSCPDGARLCKHLAAVLYGVGYRLDTQPELLFLLRGVDQQELVAAATKESVALAVRGDAADALAGDDLGAIFGIELGAQPAAREPRAVRAMPRKAGRQARATKPRATKPRATTTGKTNARNKSKPRGGPAKKKPAPKKLIKKSTR
jgi:uncharacterized Zn finger protein